MRSHELEESGGTEPVSRANQAAAFARISPASPGRPLADMMWSMAENPGGHHRYSDRETALILKLAAELEARGPAAEGHSLAEIQEIAAEVGIDPELVVQAARALEAEHPSHAALLGAPTCFRFSRSIAGEVPERELGELVSAIRQVTGREGEVATVLDSVEWRDRDSLGDSTHVEITRRGRRTDVRVTGRYANATAMTYLGGAIVATIASVIAGTEIQAAVLVEVGVISTLWGAALTGARLLWQRLAGRRERRLRELTDSLASQIAASLPAAGTRSPSEPRPRDHPARQEERK